MTTLADIAQPVLITIGVLGFLAFGYALAFGAVEYVAQRKIGENGLKPDTWYSLDKDGGFVEVEDER